MPEIALDRKRLLRAFEWTAAGTAVGYGLSFVRSVVLARLLFPADYGLFGLAAGVLMGLTVFTEFSLASKVVVMAFPTEREERIHLDTVWTAGLIRGALLAILIALSAAPAAAWFHDGRLFKVLMIISAAPFISGFQNVGLIKLQKDLAFRKLTIQQRVADILTFLITVVLAVITHNYLALVGSQLVSALTTVLLSYSICSYRPRIAFDGRALRDSFHFGKHLFVVSILTFVTTQFDNFAVGRYLGTVALGPYILAYRLAMLPVDALISILNSVLFPAYSKVRLTESGRLASFFLKLNTVSAGLVLAAVAPLALAARPLIYLLYGHRWDAACAPLPILAFAGIFRGFAHTISPWLVSIGRPDLDAKCKMVEASVFVSLTLILVPRFGVAGAAWTGVASYALAYIMRLALAVRLLEGAPVGPTFIGLVQPLWIAALAFVAARLLSMAGSPLVASLSAYYCVLLGFAYLGNRFLRVEARTVANALYRWLSPEWS
jgi:PST family polysaccharide transporter/lipopolysaccharide exporter